MSKKLPSDPDQVHVHDMVAGRRETAIKGLSFDELVVEASLDPVTVRVISEADQRQPLPDESELLIELQCEV